MKFILSLLYLIVCFFLAGCSNDRKVHDDLHRNTIEVNGYQNLSNYLSEIDSLKATYNFIHVPVSEQYRLKDSLVCDKYKFKVYHLGSKDEYLADLYFIVEKNKSNLYIVPSEYLFSGKYYYATQPSDLLLRNGGINPCNYTIFFKDLERFYNNKFADRDLNWKDIIKINHEFLQFYYKFWFKYNMCKKIESKDSLNEYLSHFNLRRYQHKETKEELECVKDYLNFKISSDCVTMISVFQDTRIHYYELYRDKMDTNSRALLLNYEFFEKDYFSFKDNVSLGLKIKRKLLYHEK